MWNLSKAKFCVFRRVIRIGTAIKIEEQALQATSYFNPLCTLKCYKTSATVNRPHGIRLVEPRILTHECLAYAKCPVCQKEFHMCDMETHLVNSHKELDCNECAKICRSRLELYQRVIGVPLTKLSIRKSYSNELESYLPTITKEGYWCNWCARRTEVHRTRDAFLKHVAGTHVEVDLDEVEPLIEFLPNKRAGNSSTSEVENISSLPHSKLSPEKICLNSTQQSSLSNVDEGANSSLPLQHKCEYITSSSSSSSSAAASASVLEAHESYTTELSTALTSNLSKITTLTTATPLTPKSTLTNNVGGTASNSHSSHSEVRPSRRMQNVKIIQEEICYGDGPLMNRFLKKGISIPRYLYNDDGENVYRSFAKLNNAQTRNIEECCQDGKSTEHKGNVSLAFDPTQSKEVTMEFGLNNFPCELCRRVFANERNLLQHLENRHPNREQEVNGASKSIRSIFHSVNKNNNHNNNGVDCGTNYQSASEILQCSYKCDMCESTKMFNSTSSLFAHIQFRHPHVDTEFEVDRIVKSQKKMQQFMCMYCRRTFVDKAALNSHMIDKHSDITSEINNNQTIDSDGSSISKSNNNVHDILSSAHRRVSNSGLPELNPKKKWWCTICEKGFSAPEAIRIHKTHKHNLPLEQYPCPACKKVYMDVYTLERHLMQSHKSINSRELGLTNHAECKSCGRLFLNFDDLHQHAVKHHNKDPLTPARTLESTNTHLDTNTTPIVASSENVHSTSEEKSTTENNDNNLHDNGVNHDNDKQQSGQLNKPIKLSEILEKRGPRKVAARRIKNRATDVESFDTLLSIDKNKNNPISDILINEYVDVFE